MPSSESLMATASPVRASIATTARAPIRAPVNPRVGASRRAASLTFLPSPITTANASRQAGSTVAGPGISSASRAVPSRSNARLTSTGVRASLR